MDAAGGSTNLRSEAIAGTRSITWAILAIAVHSTNTYRHLFNGVNGVLQKTYLPPDLETYECDLI